MSSGDLQANLALEFPGFELAVDLRLPGRGVTALFGHSGSGKTTLLRCLAGLERARGRVSINGEIWQDEKTFMPVHQRPLGYVFQEASLFPHLSVMANLQYGMRRVAATTLRVSLEQAIELLGIGHLLQRRPDRLSGGERQRVAIARALAVSPRVLCMDEPLAALDWARRQEILPFLERLHDELEIPLLYVTHAADEVARLADHLVVMDRGRALASGPLNETLARLDLPIQLGEEAGVVLQARIAERDQRWHLARAEFPGGSLWLRDSGHAIGDAVRLRVLARDVSLALTPQADSSILNRLAGEVDAVGEGEHPALRLVRVKVGDTVLISRITARSLAALGLAVGMPVWVQIKSAAMVE